MTLRQKKIIFVVAGVYVAGMILYWIVMSAFIRPASELRARQESLQAEISRLSNANGMEATYMLRYKQKVSQMLPGTPSEAGGYLEATIMQLLETSRLSSGQTQQLDIKTKAGFKVVARSVSVKGRLENLVDLLYMLQAQPFLHRLDSLELDRSDPKNNEFTLKFNYMAMLVDPAKNKRVVPSKPSTVPASMPLPLQNLDTPQRRQYDAIASRDLFRPYVKRIVDTPPPVPTPTPQPTEAPPRPTPPPRRAEFQVCSLTSWNGEQVAGVRSGSEVRYYKPGDKLEGGQVVMIDLRPLPKPDNPKLDSPSRLILKIGQEFWAVELEKNLSEKRLLKSEQLPPELKDQATSAPADSGSQEASTK